MNKLTISCILPAVLSLLFSFCSNSTVEKSLHDSVKKHLPFDSLFIATQNKKQGLIDRNGNVILPFVFDKIYSTKIYPSMDIQYMFVEKNKKAGLIDSSGRLIIDTMYQSLDNIVGDTIYEAMLNGKKGLLKQNGQILVPFKYDEFSEDWINGKAYYKQDQNFGFVNLKGEIIPGKFQTEDEAKTALYDELPDTTIFDYHDNRAKVYIKSKEQGGGYLDRKRNWAIPPAYKWAEDFSEELAAVSQDGNSWFYIDTSGRKIIAGTFRQASSFADGVAYVNYDSLINKKGEVIATTTFFIIKYDPQNKLFWIEGDAHPGPFGYMDLNGKLVVDPNRYDDLLPPSEGMIPVCRYIHNLDNPSSTHDKEWGFLNIEGKIIIQTIYEEAQSFSNGLAAVKKNGKWGFIDKTGKIIIPFEYDGATSFDRGLARVFKNGKMAYIDTTGKIIWQEK